MVVITRRRVFDRSDARRITRLGWRKLLLGCGIASSVLYVAVDLIASLRWYAGYSYRDQEFSELFAIGSPVRGRLVGEAMAGLLLGMPFAAGVWLVGGTRTARITAVLLAGFTIAGGLGGVLFRTNTREVMAAGEEDLRGSLHPAATMVMGLFYALAVAFGARLLGTMFRYYSYGTIVVVILFGTLAVLQTDRMAANDATPWMGTEERVSSYASMLSVTVLAGGLWRLAGASSTTHDRAGSPVRRTR